MDGELVVSMRVAEDGRPYVVNPSDSKRVYAKPGEVLKVSVKNGRASHAWAEPESPSAEERRGQSVQELQDLVTSRLRPFLEEVVRRLPKLDEGERSSFKVEIGVECYGSDDEPYFNTCISQKHEETGL
jgi:hypothetical protein